MATDVECAHDIQNDIRQSADFAGTDDPRVLTWHHLETMRLRSLGLPSKYSRHFTVTRTSLERPKSHINDGFDKLAVHSGVKLSELKRSKTTLGGSPTAKPIGQINIVAPFTTLMKPTCGYFFSRETDNRKKRIGIPPTDLVKYRSQPASN